MERKILGIFSGTVAIVVTLAAACGGGGSASGSLGADCDPKVAEACPENLLCSKSGEKNICTYEPGASCEPNEEGTTNSGCPESAKCAETTNEDGSKVSRCLVQEGGLCDGYEDACDQDLTCADTTDGKKHCFGKVLFVGTVFDASTKSAIEGGRVLALNDEGYAVTDVATTDAEGKYALEVPVKRNEDGSPTDDKFTLRAEARNFQEFPAGIRVALPISAKDAPFSDAKKSFVVESQLTEISLIPLPEAERFSVAGRIEGLSADSLVAGVLLVLRNESGTYTSLSDRSGEFVVFNVPDGAYTLEAYAAGIRLESVEVAVDGADVTKLVLKELDDELAEVNGNIQIVNAPGGAVTSVILVVESTFNETAARGVVPRGLRAPRSGPVSISGDFTIADVPPGKYVVLAAYENDGLVRDPDTNIAGTGFVHVEVNEGETSVTIPESFKVTEALAVVSPGKDEPELVAKKPVLTWADDSSEEWYDVVVFDAFGVEVWKKLDVPAQSGGGNVEVAYEGPLDPGMYYQFRVTSWRQPGGGAAAPISTTEDLRGVFYSEAP